MEPGVSHLVGYGTKGVFALAVHSQANHRGFNNVGVTPEPGFVGHLVVSAESSRQLAYPSHVHPWSRKRDPEQLLFLIDDFNQLVKAKAVVAEALHGNVYSLTQRGLYSPGHF